MELSMPRLWLPYTPSWVKDGADKTPICDKCGKVAEYMAVKLSPYTVQKRCKRCAK